MRFLLFISFFLIGNLSHAKQYTLTIHVEDIFEKPLADIDLTLTNKKGTIYKGKTNLKGDFVFTNLKDKKLFIEVVKNDTISTSDFFLNKKRIDTKRTFQIQVHPNFKEEINHRVDAEILEIIQSYGYNSLADLPDSADCQGNSVVMDSDFLGGFSFLRKYISQYTKYPSKSIEHGEQGKVYISCIINKDGTLSEIEVARGVSPLLDKEAIRVVENMPKWMPGFCNGVPVKVRVRFPIVFTLN
jgi:TonB family protein